MSPAVASTHVRDSAELGGHVLTRAELVDQAVAWPVTAERVLGAGSFTALLQDDITAPDGSTLQREYLQHPGAVGVIALDDAGRVALVRQYRHAVRHRLLEPPAGLLDVDGEEYVLAAQRELAEEVGLAADTWHVLVDLFTTPGIIAREPARLPGPRPPTGRGAGRFREGGRGGGDGAVLGSAGRRWSTPCSPVTCTTRPWSAACWRPGSPSGRATTSPRCGPPTHPGRPVTPTPTSARMLRTAETAPTSLSADLRRVRRGRTDSLRRRCRPTPGRPGNPGRARRGLTIIPVMTSSPADPSPSRTRPAAGQQQRDRRDPAGRRS